MYSFPLPYGPPKEGRRYVPASITTPAGGGAAILTAGLADAGVSQVVGALIDNSLNNFSVTVIAQDTGFAINVPAGCQYTGPLYTGGLTIILNVFSYGSSVAIPIT